MTRLHFVRLDQNALRRTKFKLQRSTGPNKPVEIKLINEVHHLDDFKVYMMESDYSRGCVCAEYLGYLEKERITNNKEVVYEVMTFE